MGLFGRALRLDFQRVYQLERDWSFRGKRDVAIAGQASAAGSRSRADQSADQSAFAAAGKSADQRAAAGAAANHRGCALTLALAGFFRGRGVYVVTRAVHL